MSSKKKNRTRNAAIRRIQSSQTSATRVDAMYAATAAPGEYLASLPETKRRNFIELATLMTEKPEALSVIATTPEEEMLGIVLGLAFPDIVDNPDHEDRLSAAGYVRLWHMVNQVDAPVDGWPDINGMSDEQILARIEADRDAGLIPRPRPEE